MMIIAFRSIGAAASLKQATASPEGIANAPLAFRSIDAAASMKRRRCLRPVRAVYKMTILGYNVRKAAQVTAFFAKKQGGAIDVLKLAKLLYLADREFMSRYDFPILFDRFVSMPHGPVTSMTLNYINGMLEEHRDQWNAFVEARAGNKVGVARQDLSFDDLDELSDAEIHVMEATWDQFGHMSSWEIRNHTHTNCPEWEDPQGSSTPIPYERVLKFLHKENSAEIADEIEAQRSLDKFLERAR